MTYKIILKEQSFKMEDVEIFKEKVKELINSGIIIFETRIDNELPRENIGKLPEQEKVNYPKRHYKKRAIPEDSPEAIRNGKKAVNKLVKEFGGLSHTKQKLKWMEENCNDELTIADITEKFNQEYPDEKKTEQAMMQYVWLHKLPFKKRHREKAQANKPMFSNEPIIDQLRGRPKEKPGRKGIITDEIKDFIGVEQTECDANQIRAKIIKKFDVYISSEKIQNEIDKLNDTKDDTDDDEYEVGGED